MCRSFAEKGNELRVGFVGPGLVNSADQRYNLRVFQKMNSATPFCPANREWFMHRLFELLVPPEARTAGVLLPCEGLLMRQSINEYSWCRVLGRLVAAATCGITGLRIRIYLQRAAFRKAASHGHRALEEIRNRTLGDKSFNGEDRLWLGPAVGIG